MQARHPKTGKMIRIMRSDASLWRSEKTLVWLQKQDPSISWDRWETLAVGLDDITTWLAKGKRLDFVVLPDATQESADWYVNVNHANHRMFFISRELVFKIGEAKFRSMRISNVIILEEMDRMYPFVGAGWNETRDDAALLVSIVMRVARLSGFDGLDSHPRYLHMKDHSMELAFTKDELPKKLWFFTQYYKSDKGRRQKEIRKCLEMNVECSIIDKIVLLNEKDFSSDFPATTKIEQVIMGKRLTYRHVVEWIYNNAPKDVICVFANADIYLDSETWKDVWSTKLEDVCMALLRWDVQEDGSTKVFGPRNDSQDTWALLSDSVKAKTWDWAPLEIQFGTPGCDNAILVEMLRKRFLIVNPAMSLKTNHLQLTGIRNYDPLDVVDKPFFLYVDPTGIHDMEPVFELSKFIDSKKEFKSFTRELSSAQPRVLDTYCKMLERGERYYYASKDTNTFAESSVPIYKYRNVFQTPQGLVYGYNRLFIGKEEASKEAWSKSNLSPITPAYNVKRCFAAPWIEENVKSPEGFVLHYLSKILQLRAQFGDGEFWAHKSPTTIPVLELFRWNTRELPVIPHHVNSQIWAEEVIQYPYLAKQEIRKEDIDILRSSLHTGWTSEVSDEKPRWVVMIDGVHINTEMVREWEKTFADFDWTVIFEGRTAPERIIEKLAGASGFICYGGANAIQRWGFSWVLPNKAAVIEIQNEMEPNGEAAHVSGAASLRHALAIVPRASEAATKAAIVKAVSMNVNAMSRVSLSTATSLPILRLPRSELTGFFSHSGDSFREMAKIWEEKGYVRVVEDAAAVQVWLGEVGDTLLYDRPTMDWLFAAPPTEQKWRKALFGNPKATTSGGAASSWFFWPRRPKLVEAAVSQGLSDTTYKKRVHNLVFYGKIENKVQEKRRLTLDWSAACDDYICVNGEGAKYPFTAEQYLENLAASKFGLCLAGFGKKCHREVECMAMGCVPVVSADVDMENYAEPPREGIHYLRVQTPDEAKEKVAAISEVQWQIMSSAVKQWWKTNASAEGSWGLTEKLTTT